MHFTRSLLGQREEQNGRAGHGDKGSQEAMAVVQVRDGEGLISGSPGNGARGY